MGRKLTFLLSFVLMLTIIQGCSPRYYWTKPNGSSMQFEQDLTECKIYAVRSVPESIQRVPVDVGNSSSTHCYGTWNIANCTTTGRRSLPEDALAYDANSDLRAQAVNLCLNKKGWSRFRAEDRPEIVKRAVPPKMPKVQYCKSDSDCDYGQSCYTKGGSKGECKY